MKNSPKIPPGVSPKNDELQRLSSALLQGLKQRKDELEELLQEAERTDDEFYRFYHQSFKVYRLQALTVRIVEALRSADSRAQPAPLNRWFECIVSEGTGKAFAMDHNREWLLHTRPILEAFWHAREMLRCATISAHELSESPQTLPSTWAAVLYLYDLR